MTDLFVYGFRKERGLVVMVVDCWSELGTLWVQDRGAATKREGDGGVIDGE